MRRNNYYGLNKTKVHPCFMWKTSGGVYSKAAEWLHSTPGLRIPFAPSSPVSFFQITQLPQGALNLQLSPPSSLSEEEKKGRRGKLNSFNQLRCVFLNYFSSVCGYISMKGFFKNAIFILAGNSIN